jgi:hypothetical protein
MTTVSDEREECAASPPGHQQANGSADRREQSALREELSRDSAPIRAERQPDRHLATARDRPGEQQVGDVRADDAE